MQIESNTSHHAKYNARLYNMNFIVADAHLLPI